MNFKDRLMADLKTAMLAKNAYQRDSLRMIRATIKNTEIELQRDTTDAEVEEIIAKEVKRRREAIQMFEQAGRQDLVTEEQAQLEYLVVYLPKQLSRDQVIAVVQATIDELHATDASQLGAVMRQAMSKLKGQADGKLVNEIVRALLMG